MSQYQDLLLEIRDNVAVVTLNRPEALNAYTAAMGDSLKAAIGSAASDEAVRVIVITGAGRGFCAGADMKLLQAITPGSRTNREAVSMAAAAQRQGPVHGPDVSEHFGGRFGYMMSVGKPIIAAINGPIAGLGFVLALYADIRFASSGARFTTSFAQRGLIAEHGVAWLLPRLVGTARAMDLLLSARKLEGAEAQRMGLVNEVFEQATFMESVLGYANNLANTVSPRSMAVMKAQLWKSPFQSFSESLQMADAEMLASFASEDFKEGVAHFVEKRAPRFTGR